MNIWFYVQLVSCAGDALFLAIDTDPGKMALDAGGLALSACLAYYFYKHPPGGGDDDGWRYYPEEEPEEDEVIRRRWGWCPT